MNSNSYWFPAKRYGWGWGAPLVWQGWIVLGLWMAATAVGTVALMPRRVVAYFAFIVLMVATLIAICFVKGEPPSWRWGGGEGKR
jgi:hypothetical protein